jgi:hypothetical protein
LAWPNIALTTTANLMITTEANKKPIGYALNTDITDTNTLQIIDHVLQAALDLHRTITIA